MLLFHLFMNKTASTMLNARICAEGTDKKYRRSASGETRFFTSYSQVVRFLLKKYSGDEVIAETEFEIKHSAQLSSMTPFKYAEELESKTFLCEEVYQKCIFNLIFIKGLNVSILHSMQEFWDSKKDASLHNLAYHATSLLRLQRHNETSRQTESAANKQQIHRDKQWSSRK